MERTKIEANTTYARALVRADKKGYIVSAIVKKHNEVIGCVVTGPDSTHKIIVDGNTQLCDCTAADKSKYCLHRAVATRKMIERAAQKAAQVALDAQQELDRIAHEVLTGSDVFEPVVIRTTPPMSIYRHNP